MPPLLRPPAQDAGGATVAELNAPAGLLLHQLLLCLFGEVVEFEPYSGRGEGQVLGPEIIGHFAYYMLVAARFELGMDYMLYILFGGITKEPQPLCSPKPQQAVAPGGHLEFELLIVLEPSLEFFPSVGQSRHGVSNSMMPQGISIPHPSHRGARA